MINGPVLLNVLKADPIIAYSGFASHVTPGPLNIHPYFDPSVGIIVQPLGRLGVEDLIHGVLPWWDPYEGIGSALAGEMSPAVFYPLNFLQLLPNGQTWLTVAVEIFTGVFTLLLARRIGMGLFAGTIVALLFSCNGTFSWLGSGWCYPFPLLPLLIYGVEMCFGSLLRERIAGSVCIALAIAVSISGCMIETAFLDSLFAVAWALLRLAGSRGPTLFETSLRMLFGTIAGLLIVAPLLIAFADDLRVGYVGMHDGRTPLPPTQPVILGQLFAPYILGPTFIHDAGYAGVAMTLFAICGLFGRFQRPLRFLLGGWIVLAQAATIGYPLPQQILLAIPGVKYTAFYRYLDGSWEFALALLVGFFIYDLNCQSANARLPLRAAVASLIVPLGVYCLYPAPAGSEVAVALGVPGAMSWLWISLVWVAIALVTLWCISTISALAIYRAYIVAGLTIFEAAVAFAVPSYGLPTQATLSLGSVDFLRNNLGLQRTFSLGPLIPSYGSYYHIAELNDVELPLPANWEDYQVAHLDSEVLTGMTGHFNEFARNLPAYENAAVKYVMLYRNDVGQLLSLPLPAGVKLAYTDDLVAIYELPKPSPYFAAPGCTVAGNDRTEATLQCASPSSLTRRELFMPGWSATVNGAPANVVQVDDIYQSIDVPAGNSSVRFSFLPPFMDYGYAAFLVGAFAIVYQVYSCIRLSRESIAAWWQRLSSAGIARPYRAAEEPR